MNGYYPSVSRVLLAVLAPLKEEGNNKSPNSAHALFKEAVYQELKSFPDYYDRDADEALDKLPKNARYDPKTGILYRIYRSSEDKGTNLKRLKSNNISLLDEKHWMKPPATEGDNKIDDRTDED